MKTILGTWYIQCKASFSDIRGPWNILRYVDYILDLQHIPIPIINIEHTIGKNGNQNRVGTNCICCSSIMIFTRRFERGINFANIPETETLYMSRFTIHKFGSL